MTLNNSLSKICMENSTPPVGIISSTPMVSQREGSFTVDDYGTPHNGLDNETFESSSQESGTRSIFSPDSFSCLILKLPK